MLLYPGEPARFCFPREDEEKLRCKPSSSFRWPLSFTPSGEPALDADLERGEGGDGEEDETGEMGLAGVISSAASMTDSIET